MAWPSSNPLISLNVVISHHFSVSVEAAQAGMAATDVNARWQAEMAEFFEELDGQAPDEGFLVLEEVFHLEDQLAPAPDTDVQK